MNRPVLFSLLAGTILLTVGCGKSDSSVKSPASTGTATTTKAAETAGAADTPQLEEAEPVSAPKELAVPEPDPSGGEMPREFKGLQELLAKASPEKQPKNPQLNQFSNPSRGLRWLAQHDDSAQVRSFALHALGLYPTADNAAVLLAVARDKKTASETRAAALRGMGRYDLEQEGMKSLKEHVLKTVNDKDIVIACGSVDAMHGMVTALPILEDILTNPKASAQLKAAAKRALGPQLDNDDLSGPAN